MATCSNKYRWGFWFAISFNLRLPTSKALRQAVAWELLLRGRGGGGERLLNPFMHDMPRVALAIDGNHSIGCVNSMNEEISLCHLTAVLSTTLSVAIAQKIQLQSNLLSIQWIDMDLLAPDTLNFLFYQPWVIFFSLLYRPLGISSFQFTYEGRRQWRRKFSLKKPQKIVFISFQTRQKLELEMVSESDTTKVPSARGRKWNHNENRRNSIQTFVFVCLHSRPLVILDPLANIL